MVAPQNPDCLYQHQYRIFSVLTLWFTNWLDHANFRKSNVRDEKLAHMVVTCFSVSFSLKTTEHIHCSREKTIVAKASTHTNMQLMDVTVGTPKRKVIKVITSALKCS